MCGRGPPLLTGPPASLGSLWREGEHTLEVAQRLHSHDSQYHMEELSSRWQHTHSDTRITSTEKMLSSFSRSLLEGMDPPHINGAMLELHDCLWNFSACSTAN